MVVGEVSASKVCGGAHESLAPHFQKRSYAYVHEQITSEKKEYKK